MIIPSYHKASNHKLSGDDTPLDRFIVEHSPVPPEHDKWMQMLQEVVDHVEMKLTVSFIKSSTDSLAEIQAAHAAEVSDLKQKYLIVIGILIALCVMQAYVILMLNLTA